MSDLCTTTNSVAKQLVDAQAIARALDLATSVEEIIELEAKLDAIESYMRDAGLYNTSEIRPVNETRMRARWKLGQALAAIERAQGSRTLGGLRPMLHKVGLKETSAKEAQRIGTLPASELNKAFAAARHQDVLTTYTALTKLARPFWYKANREIKHQTIRAAAGAKAQPARPGPFPLLYIDPPWKFETYSEKGLGFSADQHYPTLSDEEIAHFQVGGVPIQQIAHRDAALFLWCTSSNIVRALAIMAAWGFAYAPRLSVASRWLRSLRDCGGIAPT